MPLLDSAMGHLLRRAGFGASVDEAPIWNAMSVTAAIDALVDYEQTPDDVDSHIGVPGYLGTVSEGPFTPHLNLGDAIQRWIFRMVHSQRPLQEKMALFWHNYFATSYGKIAGQLGGEGAVRALAAKPAEDPDGLQGQLELFRERAAGQFPRFASGGGAGPGDGRVARWGLELQGQPQENFARELMELFTIGVGQFTEEDVYAGARVFTGWNLEREERGDDEATSTFYYNGLEHDTGAKTFSFAIYADGNRTIPARDAGQGAQDGLDLITALAAHPATGPRLARKLYAFFVNDQEAPDQGLVADLAATYYASGTDLRQVVRRLLRSTQFQDPRHRWARYSWPAEHVTRLLKEVGWVGFSADLRSTAWLRWGRRCSCHPPWRGGQVAVPGSARARCCGG